MARGLVAGIGLILAVGVLYFIFVVRGRDAVEGHFCAQEYAHAKTASDSTAIDARPPIKNRGEGELSGPIPTCGELRRAGRVR